MSAVAKSNKQLALLFALLLAIFSTGMVIAHQCHSSSNDQVAIQHQHLDAGTASTVAIKPLSIASDKERLIDTGCAALFLVVLLLGRKLVDLRAPYTPLNRFMTLSRDLISVYRPQVFHLALSRPQLGVIRI